MAAYTSGATSFKRNVRYRFIWQGAYNPIYYWQKKTESMHQDIFVVPILGWE